MKILGIDIGGTGIKGAVVDTHKGVFKTDRLRITLAVAGFSEGELNIESREGQLVVTGRKAETEDKANVLHRGIATRAFERRFQLADHVRAVEAVTENGLLHVDLVREVPEALKPRRIEIAHGKPAIESQAAAA